MLNLCTDLSRTRFKDSWESGAWLGHTSGFLRLTVLTLLFVYVVLFCNDGAGAISPGAVDTSFDSSLGPNSVVNAIVQRADGKLLIGGSFSSVAGNPTYYGLALLNHDGSLDTNWVPTGFLPFYVNAIALQTNGQVLVGGSSGYNSTNILRLNTDGSRDTGFNSSTDVNSIGAILAMAVQPDGKVLIAGSFSNVNAALRPRIARLNADGSLDQSFNAGSGTDYAIQAMALQPDGRIVIGGVFTTVNGISHVRLARLNPNGTVDSNFNPVLENQVNSISLQSDGGIVIGGSFYRVNGATHNYVARVKDTGAVDNAFNTGLGAAGEVYSVAALADGKVIIGGSFTAYDDVARNRVARLNQDGSLDPTFDVGSGADNLVKTIAIQSDGKVLAGGYFLSFNGMSRSRIARLYGGDVGPTITNQPTSRTVLASTNVVFNVGASGTSVLTYRWRRYGTDLIDDARITGALTASLTIRNVGTNDVGIYTAEVTNGGGVAVSSNASLFVEEVLKIASVSPLSGSVGQTVVIAGRRFQPVPEDNVVFFGPVRAAVTSATSNSLTVTVPPGATHAPITVTTLGNGLTAVSPTRFMPTFPSSRTLTSSSFASRVTFGLPGLCCSGRLVGLEDVDGDGEPDVVATRPGSNSTYWVSVFRNTGVPNIITTNSLAPAVDFQHTFYPNELTFADIDGDGQREMIVGHGSGVDILPNLSSPGTIFLDAPTVLSGQVASCSGLAVGDLDGDGRPEVLTCDYNGQGGVLIFRNTSSPGSISFAPKIKVPTATASSSVCLADFNRDGQLDIAVGCNGSNVVTVLQNMSSLASLLPSNFVRVDFPAGSQPEHVTAVDVDRDGEQDLLVLNPFGNSVSILRNLGLGGNLSLASFASRRPFQTGNRPVGFDAADIDGDGKPDLAVADFGLQAGTTVSLFHNQSSPGAIAANAFEPRLPIDAEVGPLAVAVGDLDADGKPELVAVNGSLISVYKNTVGAPPLVMVTEPTNGAIFQNPTNILLSAEVSGGEGVLNRVQFYAGTNFLGSVTNSPFTLVWSNAAPGLQALTAAAVYNVAGAWTSPPVFINILPPPVFSFTEFQIPSPRPPATGRLRLFLQPPEAVGQWRFPWEFAWRGSGVAADALPLGNYEVEFKTVSGYLQPTNTIYPVTAGDETADTRGYSPINNPPVGSLTVNLFPTQVLAMARWRIAGEAQWFTSGDTLTNLNAGVYILEFTNVTDWVTPAPVNARVLADLGSSLTVTYYVDESPSNSVATPHPLSTNSIDAAPYAFNGQILSDAGYASGFVVKDRVVVTAAHVVFNDATLSYVTGLRWFLQRQAGSYEPRPQQPRGWYAFTSYAAQRELDRTNGVAPGVSSAASRQWDFAVLYFNEPAGRGGYGGYLSSDAATNEWLASAFDKMLLSYPTEGPGISPGQLHETDAFNASFLREGAAASNRVYTTTDFKGFPGSSGGPLYVRTNTTGNFFPAAIYLGSANGHSVVRAIDRDVVDLISRAAATSPEATNEVDGGVVRLTFSGGANTFFVAKLTVRLGPLAALAAGGGWRITNGYGTNFFRVSETNVYLTGNSGTSNFIEFAVIPGYATPTNRDLALIQGQDTILTANYVLLPPPTITLQPTNFAAFVGTTAGNRVAATGAVTLLYQWQHNSQSLAGATNPTLQLNNVSTQHAGLYRAIVSGTGGNATSTQVFLTVLPLPQLEIERTNELVRLRLTAPVGYAYTIQEAAGVNTDWTYLTNFLQNTPVRTVTNPITNAPLRIFRAITP